MDHFALTALSTLDGRYSAKTEPLKSLLSEYGLMKHRVIVEVRWLQALATCDDIPELQQFSEQAQHFLEDIEREFGYQDAHEIKTIENKTNHDVKAVEYFLKHKSAMMPELAQASEFIHFACTSEDINNTAYALMLAKTQRLMLAELKNTVINPLRKLAHETASLAMLSRTHGQSASPTTLGKEVANVVDRLQRCYTRIDATKITAKLNGAVGNYNAHQLAYPEVDWPKFSEQVLQQLGLQQLSHTTQIEPHDEVAVLCHEFALTNTVLIDFCRDVWTYISLDYFKLKLKEGEVGSSTMPHKVNPIDFENAEGNLGLANSHFYHFAQKLPISRLQRDLSDSTVLRALGQAFGHTLIALQSLAKGLGKLTPNEEKISQDLDNNWAVLAEAVQTVMRKHNLPMPYEQLKALTRGKNFDGTSYQAFVQDLTLPEGEKSKLLALTPQEYTGLAEKLAALI